MNLYEFILQFAEHHPFLTFCVIWVVSGLCLAPFKLTNRWIRHQNIKAKGWPPPYLDADGDCNEKGSDK